MSQTVPLYPGSHVQVKEGELSEHVPCLHGLSVHFTMSKTIQSIYKTNNSVYIIAVQMMLYEIKEKADVKINIE